MTVRALLVGAGQRGRYVYGNYARGNPGLLKIIAVVEPDPSRRSVFAEEHSIADAHQFATWKDGSHALRDVDVCIVASPDRHHAEPAVAALEAGVHVLLEKPIAHSLSEVARVVDADRRSAASLHVAHVLRYTPFFRALHAIVTSGRLGELISVEHRENVVSWHMAHSFVRGNWARAAEATPMIVQKCCHDLDVMAWNLDSPVRRLHSFGSLHHFRPDHAPEGATERCLDCPAAETCPFDAQRIYLDMNRRGWPVHVITDDLSEERRRHALRHGPYGKCVYTAESDVVDHQTVSMELESGATAVLIMHGHAHHENRSIRYDGSHGTVRAIFGATKSIEFTDHRGGNTERIAIDSVEGGHGGGDPGLIGSFLASISDGRPSLTSGQTSFESHLLAFCAEQSRVDGEIVDVTDRRRSALG